MNNLRIYLFLFFGILYCEFQLHLSKLPILGLSLLSILIGLTYFFLLLVKFVLGLDGSLWSRFGYLCCYVTKMSPDFWVSSTQAFHIHNQSKYVSIPGFHTRDYILKGGPHISACYPCGGMSFCVTNQNFCRASSVSPRLFPRYTNFTDEWWALIISPQGECWLQWEVKKAWKGNCWQGFEVREGEGCVLLRCYCLLQIILMIVLSHSNTLTQKNTNLNTI